MIKTRIFIGVSLTLNVALIILVSQKLKGAGINWNSVLADPLGAYSCNKRFTAPESENTSIASMA